LLAVLLKTCTLEFSAKFTANTGSKVTKAGGFVRSLSVEDELIATGVAEFCGHSQ
jgi:hypothetical protein